MRALMIQLRENTKRYYNVYIFYLDKFQGIFCAQGRIFAMERPSARRLGAVYLGSIVLLFSGILIRPGNGKKGPGCLRCKSASIIPKEGHGYRES